SDRFFTGRSNAGHLVAHVLQAVLYITSDDLLVFDQQDLSTTRHPNSPLRGQDFAARCRLFASTRSLKRSSNVVPPLRSTRRLPPSCSFSVHTSCRPSDCAVARSSPGGKPTPLSCTIRTNSFPSLCRSISTAPPAPLGNACFKALETSSLMIKPHGIAVSM